MNQANINMGSGTFNHIQGIQVNYHYTTTTGHHLSQSATPRTGTKISTPYDAAISAAANLSDSLSQFSLESLLALKPLLCNVGELIEMVQFAAQFMALLDQIPELCNFQHIVRVRKLLKHCGTQFSWFRKDVDEYRKHLGQLSASGVLRAVFLCIYAQLRWAPRVRQMEKTARSSLRRLGPLHQFFLRNHLEPIAPDHLRAAFAQLSSPDLKYLPPPQFVLRDQLGQQLYVPIEFCDWEELQVIVKRWCRDKPGNEYIRDGSWELINSQSNQAVDGSTYLLTIDADSTLDVAIIMALGFSLPFSICPSCGCNNSRQPKKNGWTTCFGCDLDFKTSIAQAVQVDTVDKRPPPQLRKPSDQKYVSPSLNAGGDTPSTKLEYDTPSAATFSAPEVKRETSKHPRLDIPTFKWVSILTPHINGKEQMQNNIQTPQDNPPTPQPPNPLPTHETLLTPGPPKTPQDKQSTEVLPTDITFSVQALVRSNYEVFRCLNTLSEHYSDSRKGNRVFKKHHKYIVGHVGVYIATIELSLGIAQRLIVTSREAMSAFEHSGTDPGTLVGVLQKQTIEASTDNKYMLKRFRDIRKAFYNTMHNIDGSGELQGSFGEKHQFTTEELLEITDGSVLKPSMFVLAQVIPVVSGFVNWWYAIKVDLDRLAMSIEYIRTIPDISSLVLDQWLRVEKLHMVYHAELMAQRDYYVDTLKGLGADFFLWFK